MITKSDKEKAKEMILCAKTIGLVSHVRMDPDAFGCVLGLQEVLEVLGKKVVIFSEEKLIPFIKNIEPKTKYRPRAEFKNVDLVIMCDTALTTRIASPDITEKLLLTPVVVIDHHASETENLPNFIYLKEKRASASEMCYEICRDFDFPITKKASNYFYVGLISDTNDLKYKSVTPITRKLEKEIREKSDKNIRDRIATAVEKDRKKKEGFYQYCCKQIIKSKKYEAMVALVTKEDLQKFKMEESIGSQLANYIEEQYPDKASFVLMEMLNEDKVKCSFRSNNTNFNVRKLAEQYGGGGHDLASGLTLDESLEEAAKKFC